MSGLGKTFLSGVPAEEENDVEEVGEAVKTRATKSSLYNSWGDDSFVKLGIILASFGVILVGLGGSALISMVLNNSSTQSQRILKEAQAVTKVETSSMLISVKSYILQFLDAEDEDEFYCTEVAESINSRCESHRKQIFGKSFMCQFLCSGFYSVVLMFVFGSTFFFNARKKKNCKSNFCSDSDEVTLPSGTVRDVESMLGKTYTMGFQRRTFEWTEDHVGGAECQRWEKVTDVADEIFDRNMDLSAFKNKLVEMAKEQRETKEKRSLEMQQKNEDLKTAMVDTEIDSNDLIVVDELDWQTTLPGWVDMKLLDEGCRLYVQVWPFLSYAFSWAMMGGFGAEAAAAVLLKSRYWANEGETGMKDSWLRLLETFAFLHDMAAHGADGFKPDGPSWKSCMQVRFLHCRTRATMWAQIEQSRKNNKGVEEIFDTSKYGEPINQAQLIGVLLGSSVLLIEGMEEMAFGYQFSQRQRDSLVHFWGVIGHLFGIKDNPNNKDYDKAKCVMDSVFSFFIPEKPSPEVAHTLTQHICNTVSFGVKMDYGATSATPGTVASPGWLFLGASYGDAIGLPKPTQKELLYARFRACCLGVALLFAMKLPWAVEGSMRWMFKKAMERAHCRVPNCRFGSSEQKQCPFTGKGASGKAKCPFSTIS